MSFPDLSTLTVGPTPWMMLGCCLLALSLFVTNPPAVALGLASLATAIAALRLPTLPSQLPICGGLAVVFTLVMRGLLPKESAALAAASMARVCDAIAPGAWGRVHYEGAIWHARCQISDVAIARPAQVSVIERQGNTWIVLPLLPSRSTTD